MGGGAQMSRCLCAGPAPSPPSDGGGTTFEASDTRSPIKDPIDLLSLSLPITAAAPPHQASANPSDHSGCHGDKMVHNSSCLLQ